MAASLKEPLNLQADLTPRLLLSKMPSLPEQIQLGQRCIPPLSRAITLAAPDHVPKQLFLLVLHTLLWELLIPILLLLVPEMRDCVKRASLSPKTFALPRSRNNSRRICTIDARADHS
jgi:hypothetical protein